MATETHQIMEEIQFIKEELSYIKDHMVDIDSILTEEDYKALLEYRDEKEKKKLISHQQLQKELDL